MALAYPCIWGCQQQFQGWSPQALGSTANLTKFARMMVDSCRVSEGPSICDFRYPSAATARFRSVVLLKRPDLASSNARSRAVLF